VASSLEVVPWAVVRGFEALRSGATVPIRELAPVLEDALERHGRALLWDMDGIEGNRPQLDLLKDYEGLGLWVDAGVRSAEGVIDVLVAGADKVVVGTKSLRALEELQKAFSLTENVLLQVDYDGRVLHPRAASKEPTAADLAAFVRAQGGDSVLLVATRSPLDLDVVRAAAAHARVYAGIVPMADLPALQGAGAVGAIVDLWEVMERTS